MTEVFMPKAGMAMEEGVLIRWLKEVGDYVELDEPIMEIETDKVTMDAEAPASGYLLKKYYDDGVTVPVLTTLGYIGEKDELAPDAPPAKEGETQSVSVQAQSSMPVKAEPVPGAYIPATPYARKIAEEEGVSLSQVIPTGSFGEVRARDIKAATPLASAVAKQLGVDIAAVQGSGYQNKVRKADVVAAAAPAKETAAPLKAMRKRIGERMLQSHLEIPPVTQHMYVDMDELLELRERINRSRSKEQRITINDFVIGAAAIAARENAGVRSTLRGETLVTSEYVHIGVAVGLDDGLIVPVIRDADKLRLSEISSAAKELAARAREGKLMPDDYGNGTLTISNMGMFDVFAFTPIINQPEAVILGVCSVREELALIDGEVRPKHTMVLSLTFDHRILDGVSAAKFQRRVKTLLENPADILI